MKLKVNVQLASWATWNEFQGAHFFELKLRGPKGRAPRGGSGGPPPENFQILGAFWCFLVHSGAFWSVKLAYSVEANSVYFHYIYLTFNEGQVIKYRLIFIGG